MRGAVCRELSNGKWCVLSRRLIRIEAAIDALLLAVPEEDFAFLLKKGNAKYAYEKGRARTTKGYSWHSASKMLQACAAYYQIKKGVVSASDSISSIIDSYRIAHPTSVVLPYLGDATIQDALDFSTDSSECRDAGSPRTKKVPQVSSWLKCVSEIPNNEMQSAPAGTDGSTEYSTGHQDQYGAAILMNLLLTGATYSNAQNVSTPFVDWRDVWYDFVLNEATFLAGTQVGTAYFTPSDVIKKLSIEQYMQVLEALDDPSSSTAFLNKPMRDSYFTDNNTFMRTPILGGVNDQTWTGIDSH